MENLENNKLYQAIVELREKGSLQEQAKKLCDEEKLYKKLIDTYNTEMQEVDDMEMLEELFLMRSKYKIILENIKDEMCYLNTRFIDNMKVFDELMEIKAMNVELFVDTFNLDWEEYDEEADCYSNLLKSTNYIGHVCRTGLIQNKKIIKEMMED